MNEKIEIRKKKRKLLAFDLDGTLTNKTFDGLNERIKNIVSKLKSKYTISIFTGRNYKSALPFYKDMGLDTILATYNGAYINNPSNKNFPELFFLISNEKTLEFLKEEFVKKNLKNLLIDTFEKKNSINVLETISSSEDEYYKEIFFNGNDYKLIDDIEKIGEFLEKKDVLQIVLEIENKNETFNEIMMILKEKYEKCFSFYSGNKLKAKEKGNKILIPDEKRIIIKIRQKLANKNFAADYAASYYNAEEIIAFGNDDNDREMIEKNFGVVPNGSSLFLKSIAKVITKPKELDSDAIIDWLLERFKEDLK